MSAAQVDLPQALTTEWEILGHCSHPTFSKRVIPERQLSLNCSICSRPFLMCSPPIPQ